MTTTSMRRLAALLFTIAAPHGLAAQGAPRLVPVATIGCSDCGGAAEFVTISGLVQMPAGDVVVLGSAAPSLRVFDHSGRVKWTAGREGAGPGEYRLPMHVVAGPSGIQVVDMTLRRVARLTSDGAFQSNASVGGFPAAVAARAGTDEFLVLTDDFRGSKVLHRWTWTDSAQRVGAIPAPTDPGAVMTFASIAVDRNSTIAAAPDVNEYLIHRLDAKGKVTGTWTRDIPRVARTPDEIAAQDRIRQKARGQAAAEASASRGRAAPPLRTAGVAELKPHLAIDGLRFDDSGRLWVRTMRGDQSRTILDVFASGGAFLGEVVVPHAMSTFSLGGKWLAADIEWEDGTRRVMVWEVSAR